MSDRRFLFAPEAVSLVHVTLDAGEGGGKLGKGGGLSPLSANQCVGIFEGQPGPRSLAWPSDQSMLVAPWKLVPTPKIPQHAHNIQEASKQDSKYLITDHHRIAMPACPSPCQMEHAVRHRSGRELSWRLRAVYPSPCTTQREHSQKSRAARDYCRRKKSASVRI